MSLGRVPAKTPKRPLPPALMRMILVRIRVCLRVSASVMVQGVNGNENDSHWDSVDGSGQEPGYVTECKVCNRML